MPERPSPSPRPVDAVTHPAAASRQPSQRSPGLVGGVAQTDASSRQPSQSSPGPAGGRAPSASGDGAGTQVDRGVHAAALASLPRATPRRLHRLLDGRDPAEVWRALIHGEAIDGEARVAAGDAELRRLWVDHARSLELGGVADRLEALDAWVTTPTNSAHPPAVVGDIDPAPILFRRGRVPAAASPSVAMVGTRRCTPTGRSVAMELGSGLAAAGVTVVSGLALGIDGAAHRGALAVGGAPVVAVVGSGLDVVYPRGNRDLWDQVAEAGTLLGEAPLGAEPEGWRFPARNRLLAALADVVVVVESKMAGGSMRTVEEAMRRGVAVMAVPGSVRNPAAAGTNQLLSEGCAPVCCVDDVLVALGLATATATDTNRPAAEAAPGSGTSESATGQAPGVARRWSREPRCAGAASRRARSRGAGSRR